MEGDAREQHLGLDEHGHCDSAQIQVARVVVQNCIVESLDRLFSVSLELRVRVRVEDMNHSQEACHAAKKKDQVWTLASNAQALTRGPVQESWDAMVLRKERSEREVWALSSSLRSRKGNV